MDLSPPRRRLRAAGIASTVVAAVLLVGLTGAQGAAAPPRPVASDDVSSAPAFDVVVVGSEPEAIAAAVAAAEAGASTLLVSEAPRLGGLFVTGMMNVLDLRTTPTPFQLGLFDRWWRAVGWGHAFDVARAERAFATLLWDAGVEVRLDAGPVAPVVDGDRVVGVTVGGESIRAAHTVDGTPEGDLAAAAGARSTVGWESLGLDARMVDTLVFRIDGIDWDALRSGARARGRSYAYVDDRVAYGHFGGHPAAFRAETPGIRLRGLNLGRQDDGTVLVNALLIYGVDPFDRQSVADGHARASAEVPRVIEHLSHDVPGFERARPGGVAETLYVRETRHLDARCILTGDDVLDNVVTPMDVAAGGYPIDVQTLRPTDDGYVFGAPDVYGGRLCMNVPRGVEGLWVVGKAAGFDPIAHASARVVPFGMALAEAVGLAAATAAAIGATPHEVVEDEAFVAGIRHTLLERGAYLPPVRDRPAAGPADHAHYDAYRAMLRWGLAVGGYENEPRLDAPVSRTGLLYLLSNVLQRVHRDAAAGPSLIDRFGLADGPLDAPTAAAILAEALCIVERCPGGGTWSDLQGSGLGVPEPQGPLTRGGIYELASVLIGDRMPGVEHAFGRR